jgi:hypothetical protein
MRDATAGVPVSHTSAASASTSAVTRKAGSRLACTVSARRIRSPVSATHSTYASATDATGMSMSRFDRSPRTRASTTSASSPA